MSARGRDLPPPHGMPPHGVPPVTLQKRHSLTAAHPRPMPEIRDAKSLQDVSAHHASEIVQLNVGGKRYSTFYETLCRVRSQYFNNFVRIDETSGKVLLYHRNFVEDSQNAIFVNRDGDLFAYILQHLRDGKKMVLPEDVYTLRCLLREAEFFGLDTFHRRISDELRFEEKKREDAEDSMTSLRNTVSQISQSLYYNGFKR